MSSLELVDFINAHRKQQAESAGAEFPSREFAELDHADFMKKVPKVLGGGVGKFSDTYQNPQNKQVYPCYRFPKREACLMAMSYSYELQAAVFDHMTALEAKLAQPIAMPSYAESLRLLADQIEETARVTVERDLAVATKALIGSKREATAMATAAQAKREAAKLRDQLGFNCRHATILAVEHATGGEFAFLGLRRWCKANGVTAETVPDKRYPAGVKAWPAAAWLAVYGIELVELFGGEAA